MKFIICLLITAIGYAKFFDINPDKLERLCSDPPRWMLEQIEEDLKPYSQGVTKTALDTCEQQVPVLIRLKIQGNKLSWTSRGNFKGDKRLLRSLDLLRAAMHQVCYPDCEFLVTVLDCFDYPDLLEQTCAPIVTICKQKTNKKAVLWPEMLGYPGRMIIKDHVQDPKHDIAWEEKKAIAFWRGRSTGFHIMPHNWDSIYRAPLVLFSKRYPDLVNARFTGVHWSDPKVRHWFLEHKYIVPFSRPTAQTEYKYQIAVDGNTFPTSLIWQLASNSTVIKNRTGYIEWFHRGLIEGTHYVAYDTDCRDLKNVILYLREHDDEARQIAQNATDFANEYLTAESAAAYIYHLLTAYAKLQQGVLCDS